MLLLMNGTCSHGHRTDHGAESWTESRASASEPYGLRTWPAWPLAMKGNLLGWSHQVDDKTRLYQIQSAATILFRRLHLQRAVMNLGLHVHSTVIPYICTLCMTVNVHTVMFVHHMCRPRLSRAGSYPALPQFQLYYKWKAVFQGLWLSDM